MNTTPTTTSSLLPLPLSPTPTFTHTHTLEPALTCAPVHKRVSIKHAKQITRILPHPPPLPPHHMTGKNNKQHQQQQHTIISATGVKRDGARHTSYSRSTQLLSVERRKKDVVAVDGEAAAGQTTEQKPNHANPHTHTHTHTRGGARGRGGTLGTSCLQRNRGGFLL